MRKALAATLLGLLAAGVALAPAGAVASLRKLVEAADLIAVADMISGSQTGHDVTFTLVLDRVLKGSAVPGSVCTVDWESQFVWGRPSGNRVTVQLDKRRGLWFLKAASAGRYQLLPVNVGYIPFPLTFYPVPLGPISADFAYPATASLGDKVVQEMGAAAEQLDAAPSKPSEGNPFSRQLVSAFWSWNSPSLRALYDRFSKSSSANLRALGLAGLIRLGDASAVVRAEREMTVLAKTASAGELWSVLAFFRGTDPDSVRAIGRLATSKQFGVEHRQSSLASVLASIHTREAVPFLAALLDSPWRTARSQAVGGLSAFTRNLPVITPENSRTGESERTRGKHAYTTEETERHYFRGAFRNELQGAQLIAFWKGWWERHKHELSQ